MAAVAEPKKNPGRKFKGEVFIDREGCKGCGFCIEFCPTRVLELDDNFNKKGYHPPIVADIESCTGCDLCGLFCPDFAIHAIRIRIGDQEVDNAG
ncbi:MAG: 4Fe-4S dicluster domain-containing protein [Deltaproteobacteria bacterium]|nr:4Fe-4S dicluster domain-containing protein [Deltaproteobacteria bacterium]